MAELRFNNLEFSETRLSLWRKRLLDVIIDELEGQPRQPEVLQAAYEEKIAQSTIHSLRPVHSLRGYLCD